MKILSLNLGNYSSTGNIAAGIKEEANNSGIEYVLSYPADLKNKARNFDDIQMASRLYRRICAKIEKITGYEGCASVLATLRLNHQLKKQAVDLIHLHNLHGWYLNLPLLFRYIKRHNLPVIWTLHDCWSFTGHCPYFTMKKCDKWKTGCSNCPVYREYPASLFDNSQKMYELKKKWFTGVPNMTIVTPSQWLADLVKQSYLKDYPVKVIHNGIDLEIFKPTPSDFRQKYGIPDDKYIVLGVAFDWGTRKGLDVFVDLSKRLDKNKYQIVLVGTNDMIDQQLSESIISIHRTQDQKELAEIYTAVDVFVNPTREEVLGLVNIEALACGTPVITFRTGGSPECIDDSCGSVVECDDVDAMENEIIRICNERPYSSIACCARARQFDKIKRFEEYIQLYESEL